MNDGEFEWDDSKAASNMAKHGVRFEFARDVFNDIFAVEQINESERYDEVRFLIIGMVGDQLLTVAYTMRGSAIRIISARGAEPYEHRLYHEENPER
jgi:uncharacterized protein